MVLPYWFKAIFYRTQTTFTHVCLSTGEGLPTHNAMVQVDRPPPRPGQPGAVNILLERILIS